jgi:predicted nucleic acid-binding protein
MNAILANFENGLCDFNDGLIAHSCLKNGWKLITNDSDLTTGGIELLTANRTLLQTCS